MSRIQCTDYYTQYRLPTGYSITLHLGRQRRGHRFLWMSYENPPNYLEKLNTYDAWMRLLRDCGQVYDDMFRPVSLTALTRVLRVKPRETPPPELHMHPDAVWRDPAGHYFIRGDDDVRVTPPHSERLVSAAVITRRQELVEA